MSILNGDIQRNHFTSQPPTMDTVPDIAPVTQQDGDMSATANNSDGNNRARFPSLCSFPHAHHVLVREIETLERTLVDERRARRDQDIMYTTLIVGIAEWALSRLEMDYQFRLNDGRHIPIDHGMRVLMLIHAGIEGMRSSDWVCGIPLSDIQV